MKNKKRKTQYVPETSEAVTQVRTFLIREDGVTTVEIILILIVLISLVVLFKDQLTSVVSSILEKVRTNSDAI